MTLARISCRRRRRARSLRFLEFFAAIIRNLAYGHDVAEFMAWCEDNQVPSITAVQPLHVAARIEQQTRTHAAPTAKLRRRRCAICSTGW